MCHKLWVVCLLFTVATTVSADFTDRFKTHGRFNNYAVWQDTDRDDGSLQVGYSFKYNFFDCEVGYKVNVDRLTTCKDSATAKFYGYFSYTGEFDFYMGTRTSGPVINRTSNPAFHGLWEFTEKGGVFDWIDLGIEHRSNGQVIDAGERDDRSGSPTIGEFLTEIEFQNGNREYFDAISRGANYLSLAIGRHQVQREFGWSLSFKHYFNHESEITWGDLAGKDVSIEDYDILRFGYSDSFDLGFDSSFPEITLALEYILGEELEKTDSMNLMIVLPYRTDDGWDIPWTLRIHRGPMDRLSNYTESIDSIGLGVTFSY